MIYIREGSHVHTLLLLLATVGEYPVSSLHLLGSKRTWKTLIQKLCKTQEYCLKDADKHFRCKLITVSGKGKQKTVRLHISSLVILEKLDPDAYRYYQTHFDWHHFSGNRYHIDRHHRIAEALVMCLRAGIMCWPHKLPAPDSVKVQRNEISKPMFYLSLALKDFWEGEMNKTKFSRMVGTVLCPGFCFMVYNSRGTLMKWSGNGESKVQSYLSVQFCMRLPGGTIRSSILFGDNYLVAQRTLEEAQQRRRYDLRFDNVYKHIHFIPLNEFGIKQLRTLLIEDWHQAHLDILYDEEEQQGDFFRYEFDAVIDGIGQISFIDGDLCKLIRVRDAMKTNPKLKYTIICYPEQVSMIQEYFVEFRGTGRLGISTVGIDDVLNILMEE